jgi:hypothetical protein
VAYLARYADKFTLLRNDHNAGYAGANNRAMSHALEEGADYVWLLNNDATVHSDALSLLIAAAHESEDIGLLSPVIYYFTQPDQIWNCGAMLNEERTLCPPIRDIETAHRLQATEPRRLALYGTALVVRRSLIQRIGLLDEDFFAYYEDIDYSIRSIDANFKNIIVEQSVVYHDKSPDEADDRSRSYWHYFDIRNKFILMRKHAPQRHGLKGKLWYTKDVLRRLEVPDESAEAKEVCLDALWDVWRGVTGPFDPYRHMPWPLRSMLSSRPRLWRRLLEAI